jgi:hypothetical protein
MSIFAEKVYKIPRNLDLPHTVFIEIFLIPTEVLERDEVR